MPQAIKFVRDEATRQKEQASLNLDDERRAIETKRRVTELMKERALETMRRLSGAGDAPEPVPLDYNSTHALWTALEDDCVQLISAQWLADFAAVSERRREAKDSGSVGGTCLPRRQEMPPQAFIE